jgi:DNA mismatch repair protein MutS
MSDNTAQDFTEETNGVLIPEAIGVTLKPKHPPMLEQYLAYKKQYVDTLLFFQVGDFYEVFFEDAVTIAKIINLTLTSRDKNSPNPVPMAGVPISAIEGYLERLVAAGYSVAVVSQTGAANAKGAFERKLERVVTPGLKILSSNDVSRDEVTLAVTFVDDAGEYAVVWGSIQSGNLQYRDSLSDNEALQLLSRILPSEIVVPKESGLPGRLGRTVWGQRISIKIRGENTIQSTKLNIAGFDGVSQPVRRALKMLSHYLEESMVDPSVVLKKIAPSIEKEVMHLDAITRANLELLRNAKDGSAAGSLVSFLDETSTPGGARLLRQWIAAPLLSTKELETRLDRVEYFLSKREERNELRKELSKISDIERLATRIELLVAGPRELGALRDSLQAIVAIRSTLQTIGAPVLLDNGWSHEIKKLSDQLTKTLCENLPLGTNEGGMIASSIDAEVDNYRELRVSGTTWLDALERQERARTGIASLKIRSNGVLGYFFEITRANVEKIPSDYIRRQSTAQAERFTTEELRKKESEVVSAEGKLFAREKLLFEALRKEILPQMVALRLLSRCVSELDLFLAFAHVAEREGYVRPSWSTETEIVIEEGRHPILSASLGRRFIPNSLQISYGKKGAYILTGPNMGGKSTYLRKNALIVVMAQIGSYVPARTAKLGIVDRIFARLGASDNLLEGESTFMVEMKEAALILSNATSKSFVLIDELGRGTATADGLSLAHAIFEELATKTKCRMLFATHFHELTELSKILPGVGNLSVGSVEEDGQVIFTHQIHEGPALESYGIEVAKLAGIPDALIARAEDLLEHHKALANKEIGAADRLTPKAREATPKLPTEFVAIKKKLAELDVDEITPRQALDILVMLKKSVS